MGLLCRCSDGFQPSRSVASRSWLWIPCKVQRSYLHTFRWTTTNPRLGTETCSWSFAQKISQLMLWCPEIRSLIVMVENNKLLQNVEDSKQWPTLLSNLWYLFPKVNGCKFNIHRPETSDILVKFPVFNRHTRLKSCSKDITSYYILSI